MAQVTGGANEKRVIEGASGWRGRWLAPSLVSRGGRKDKLLGMGT